MFAACPSEAEENLANYCASGVYLSQSDSYQLQAKQLTITNQLDQQGLDSTLGALLYQLVERSNDYTALLLGSVKC